MPRRPKPEPAPDDALTLSLFPHANQVVSIDDKIVEDAYNMVTSDGFADIVEGWTREDLKPGGAPARVSIAAVLVGVILAAYVHRTTLDTKVAEVLFNQISDRMRELLGVKTLDHHVDNDNANYQATNRALNRVINVMDSSIHIRNKRFDKKRYKSRPTRRTLTDEQITVIETRRNWIVHELLGKTFKMLPRDVRRQYKGSLAVDGTLLKQFTHPNRRGSWSADAETGWGRPKNMAGGKRQDHGMEATLAIMTDDGPCTRTAFPKLCLGAVLDLPHFNVGENGATVITEAVARTDVINFIAGDRAYNNSQEHKFQIPVASIRVSDPKMYAKFVFDYRDDQLGKQGSIAGALFIEGQLYCPSIPQRLIDATKLYRAGRVDDAGYAKLIAERAKYLIKRKAAGRGACPATGASPTARCKLRDTPLTLSNKVDEQRVGVKLIPVVAENPPQVCDQASFTILLEGNYAKLGQHLQYGSAEHRAQYPLMRSTNEGFNGAAKVFGLHAPTLRRKRGLAGQTLACLAILIAVNIHRIRTFVAAATYDADGVRRVTKQPHDPNKRWDDEWNTDAPIDDEEPPPNP